MRRLTLFILCLAAAGAFSGCSGAGKSRGPVVLAQNDAPPLSSATGAANDMEQFKKQGAGASTFGAELPNPEDETQPGMDAFWDDFEGDVQVSEVQDPLQSWNEAMFQFNDFLYYYALKPAAQGWEWLTPEQVRGWVRNFFHNLASPVRFVSCLLQAKFFEAGVVFSRFVGNTAFGMLGLGDVTSDLKPTREISSTDEDMGQTFGSWGIPNGPYIVWPLIGPSTVRDSFGYAGDAVLDLGWYLEAEIWQNALLKVGETVNDTSFRIGEYEALTEGAVDPYVVVRDAYLKFRKKKLEE
ncbi:MAG: VacJ family lipoprotein [Desulfovibrionaceae bacterium]